jgi:hypothetical protein
VTIIEMIFNISIRVSERNLVMYNMYNINSFLNASVLLCASALGPNSAQSLLYCQRQRPSHASTIETLASVKRQRRASQQFNSVQVPGFVLVQRSVSRGVKVLVGGLLTAERPDALTALVYWSVGRGIEVVEGSPSTT